MSVILKPSTNSMTRTFLVANWGKTCGMTTSILERCKDARRESSSSKPLSSVSVSVEDGRCKPHLDSFKRPLLMRTFVTKVEFLRRCALPLFEDGREVHSRFQQTEGWTAQRQPEPETLPLRRGKAEWRPFHGGRCTAAEKRILTPGELLQVLHVQRKERRHVAVLYFDHHSRAVCEDGLVDLAH